MRFSILIPVLNNTEELSACLRRVREVFVDEQTIVMDAGNAPATAKVCETYQARHLTCERGRGRQFNRGVAQATGEILIFLHADTLLPAEARTVLDQVFADPCAQIGTFRLRFDEEHWLLRFYSFWTRFDSLWTRFGDQGIVVRREFFRQCGGFPDWPLFEDVHFLSQARKRSRIISFPATVVTSAVRFRQSGLIRQQWRNGLLIWKYLRGTPAEQLRQDYENIS